MRQIAISVLSLFIALPAFADARLPVVNLSSAGVSARAAFGEPIVTPAKQTQNTTTVAKKSDTNTSDATTQKRVADAKTRRRAQCHACKNCDACAVRRQW